MTTTVAEAPAAPPPPAHPKMGYQPGLDGLRALSVAAVILYHAGFDWLPGGFLGVEVFFVVSGFLITSLLVEEWHRHGRIDLRQFWVRRARRLLPALYLLLVVVAVYAALFVPDALSRLKGDIVAALLYVTNWWLIVSQQSYFEALGRPPLLRHLWSLAVEEQWYLVWPLVFLAGMRLARGRTARLLPFVLAGAVASTVWMAVLYVPDTDPSRVYYGTDTRAAGLLLGAALAMFWAPWRSRRSAARHLVGLDVAGVLALVALVVLCLRVDEFSPWLYQGGFAVVSLVSLVAIAVVVHPGARGFRAFLGLPVLVWIGLRSYGLYLWHWPVFNVMRPDDVGLDGLPLFAARLAVTVALTEVSFRLVETPVRTGALGRAARRLRAHSDQERVRRDLRLAGAAAALLIGVIGVRIATADKVDLLTGGSERESAAGGDLAAPRADSPATPVSVPPSATPTSTPTAAVPLGRPMRVVVVGDSQALTLVRNAPKEVPGIVLRNGAVEGCGLVDEGAMRTAARFRRLFVGCKGWEQKWANAAQKADADVALVVIGAWDVFDLKMDQGELAFGTPEHDAYLLAQLHKGIEALKGVGTQVALMEVPCFRPIDAGGLKALPERGDDTRTRHLNALLRTAADADPGHVFFVSSPQGYCTDETLARDVGHRWDGVHYYKPGAQLVLDTVGPQLLQVPVV